MKNEDFLEKVRNVHGDSLILDKTKYVDSKTKVICTCPEHGDFLIIPWALTSLGRGCPKCSGKKKLTQEEFEERVKSVHNDKLDLSKAVYKSKDRKVVVICPEHGEFEITPESLFKGSGCPICDFMYNKGKTHTSFWKLCTTEQKTKWCIEKFKQIHGNKYDYSLIKEINSASEMIDIICPQHGVFKQKTVSHLIGHGCIKCSGKEKISNEEFKKRVRDLYGEQIDVSDSVYVSRKEEIRCKCKDHGYFNVTPDTLFNGSGCPVCQYLKEGNSKTYMFWRNYSQEEKAKWVKEKLKRIHGDKYDYSLITHIKNHFDTIDIICPQHGVYKQVLNYHICGNGCPKCNEPMLEREVNNELIKLGVEFIRIARFHWLGRQSFDFYIPQKKIAIECQGEQHFISVELYDGDAGLEERIKRDIKKFNLAEKNGIQILYLLYPRPGCRVSNVNKYQEIYTEENTFKTIDELIQKIREI